MAANFISMGTPAHDSERQALHFLVEGLPAGYTAFGNPWLVENTGVVYELDAIVVAPHAIYVVEIKSYRGRIDGADHDWYIPEPVPSPLKLNRLTSQVLNSRLRRESYAAGQVWVQGLVFLSATTDLRVQGPASRDRIHTRKSLLGALQDEGLIRRLSGRTTLAPASAAENDLLRVLTADQRRARPVRRVREYEILGRLDHHKGAKELPDALADAAANTALGTAGIGAGLLADSLRYVAALSGAVGIGSRVLLSRLSRSWWSCANFLEQSIERLERNVQRPEPWRPDGIGRGLRNVNASLHDASCHQRQSDGARCQSSSGSRRCEM